jgi:hypothetical protein
MSLSEPRSRTFDESVDRLTLQAMISGTTQHAKAPQKISAKLGPAENGKECDCIVSRVVYTSRIAFGSNRTSRTNPTRNRLIAPLACLRTGMSRSAQRSPRLRGYTTAADTRATDFAGGSAIRATPMPKSQPIRPEILPDVCRFSAPVSNTHSSPRPVTNASDFVQQTLSQARHSPRSAPTSCRAAIKCF